MTTRCATNLVAAAFLFGVSAQPAMAQKPVYVEAGVLSCKVAGGVGFVFGSTKQLSCVFEAGPKRERYVGVINKFGLDVGITKAGLISWAVLAPTKDYRPGGLAGSYGGVTSEATVGVGLGANVLVGGSNRTFALQPLSVQAQQGLNLAVGIAGIELRPE